MLSNTPEAHSTLPAATLLRRLHADKDPGPPYMVYGYTAEQMRAYAASKVARAVSSEREALLAVLAAAVEVVCAPGWEALSDEDRALETALRDAGFVRENTERSGA